MLSKLAKRILPKPVKSALARKWDQIVLAKLERDWAAMPMLPDGSRGEEPPAILIFPADTRSLTGSIGDEAMLSVTIKTIRSRFPEIQIDILTSHREADEVARARGLHPIRIPSNWNYVPRMNDIFRKSNYKLILLIGADIMDGHYGSSYPAKMLIASYLSSKREIISIFLGFSFNSLPDLRLKPFFDGLNKNSIINLRDPVSLKRFNQFSKSPANLVADVAFLLDSETLSPDTTESIEWIVERKNSGKRVIGFNAHPLLYKNSQEDKLNNMILKSIDIISEFISNSDLSFIFIPHDYRGDKSDETIMRPIYDELTKKHHLDVHFVSGRHSAAALKAISGSLDGLVSGRMHLSIGALSAGVPVLNLTYQDKTQGLMRHAGLPDWLLLSPEEAFENDELAPRLVRLIENLPELRAAACAHLPTIKASALANFDKLPNRKTMAAP